MRNYTEVFFGKTEMDIEDQFAEWQKEKAGIAFNIKAPKDSAAFAMLIEFKRKARRRSRLS